MGLETVTNIADLVRTNPTSSDPKSQGDDHLRNIKTALLNDLVGFPGAIMVTGTDGGAVNAYTLTPAYGTFIAYGNRMVAVFSPTITNTGASTLNISGLGAKDVKSVDGVALVANDLAVGSIYAAFYNGTEFRLLSITKNYADQLSFSAALPAQAGNADKLLGTNGAAAAWTELLKAGTIRWADSSDTTKLLAFNVSAIATGTTRTVTFPNTDVVLNQYMKVSDQKASGTNGGSSLSSDITQTRTLNTVEVNTIAGASLAADTVTLPAGTYICSGRASTGGVVGGSKIFLYNTTDSTYALIGINGSQAANGPTYPEFSGQFTIAGTKNFKMRHWTGNAVATTGLGVAAASGQVEVYAELEFWRIA